MKHIPLTKGKFAIVDDADYGWLMIMKWQFCGGYAVHSCAENGKRIHLYMHRLINQTPTGFDCDHINRDKLDNRRCNLRTATKSENHAAKRISRANTTGFKGITFAKQKKKWRAQIHRGGKNIHIGYYRTAEEAAIAYAVVHKNIYGEFSGGTILYP